MKLTEKKLRRVIREELSQLNEYQGQVVGVDINSGREVSMPRESIQHVIILDSRSTYMGAVKSAGKAQGEGGEYLIVTPAKVHHVGGFEIR
jgi:hypothetical protein